MAKVTQEWRKRYILTQVAGTAEVYEYSETLYKAGFLAWCDAPNREAVPIRHLTYKAVGVHRMEEWHKLCGVAANYFKGKGYVVTEKGDTFSSRDGGRFFAEWVAPGNKRAQRVCIVGPKYYVTEDEETVLYWEDSERPDYRNRGDFD